MTAHYKSWKIAFEEITYLQVVERSIYLLEGMRGIDLVKDIFKKYNYTDPSKTQVVIRRKDEVFRSILNIRPYEKVNDILQELCCLMGIVSGSAKQDVVSIVNQCLQKKIFEIILTGDDIAHGKPDPEGFKLFLQRVNLKSSDVLVVENSPLGLEASINAGIKPIVVLNNSPLRANDFVHLIAHENIYRETKNIEDKLVMWCDDGK